MILLDQIKQKQKAVIESITTDAIPLKLIEMGCLPGNTIWLVQNSAFKDPLYLVVDGNHIAIRREVAKHIVVKIIS